MGLIDLFQKTRETSMELKPQEEETTNKVVTCKGCGAELKAYAYGKNLYVCPHCGRYGRLLARTRIRQILHPQTRFTSRVMRTRQRSLPKRSACLMQSRPVSARSAVWKLRSV